MEFVRIVFFRPIDIVRIFSVLNFYFYSINSLFTKPTKIPHVERPKLFLTFDSLDGQIFVKNNQKAAINCSLKTIKEILESVKMDVCIIIRVCVL